MSLEPFTLQLPWESEIDGNPVTEVRFDFVETDVRYYSNVRIVKMENTGPAVSPSFSVGFALARHAFSFNYDASSFLDALEQIITGSLARHYVQESVELARPVSIHQVPGGIKWPLSEDVVDYVDSGGAQVPVPHGIFCTFRIFPLSEFLTATEIIPLFRGDPGAY